MEDLIELTEDMVLEEGERVVIYHNKEYRLYDVYVDERLRARFDKHIQAREYKRFIENTELSHKFVI